MSNDSSQYPGAIELLGPNAVARLLNISRQALYVQIARGRCIAPPLGFKGQTPMWDHAAVLRAIAIREAVKTSP